jgi:hypothetical protein
MVSIYEYGPVEGADTPVLFDGSDRTIFNVVSGMVETNVHLTLLHTSTRNAVTHGNHI